MNVPRHRGALEPCTTKHMDRPAAGGPMTRVTTGCRPLDEALGGGLSRGSTLVVEGPQGVGSTEFALSLLRASAASGHATFASALRSPGRARAEAVGLLGEDAAASITFAPVRPDTVEPDALGLVEALGRGDVLALESASALARSPHVRDLVTLVERLADPVHEHGGLLLILHAPGTLPHQVEHRLQEAVDGVFTFAWRDGGPTRRRSLFITKLRGLAPALDGEQVPVFEATLQNGVGYSVSRVRSVV